MGAKPRAQECGSGGGSKATGDRFLENDGGVGGKERDSTASKHRLPTFLCGNWIARVNFENFIQLP